MGHGLCSRRRAGEPMEEACAGDASSTFAQPLDAFGARDDTEPATDQDRMLARSLCARCRLACSRVAMEALGELYTVGQLRDYVSDMQARERMLNGFDGEEERKMKGLSGTTG